jgi:hypothetical protein
MGDKRNTQNPLAKPNQYSASASEVPTKFYSIAWGLEQVVAPLLVFFGTGES